MLLLLVILLLMLLDLAMLASPSRPASVDEALVSGDAAARVLISNVAPRTTVDGEILPVHDGGVYRYGAGAEAGWYFYGMSYGLCREDPEGGCADHSANACGFRDDHNVSIYRSPDLSQHSWTPVGSALPAGRPKAIYYRPKVLYNTRTKLYVLWVNWRECLPCSLYYLTATSASPTGPFVMANSNVTTRYKDGGDFTVFADDDGVGYLLYQSRASGHVASVERLSDDYTSSLGAVDPVKHSSGLFGPKGIEAPALFKRNGYYYASVGLDCCFCAAGSGVTFFTATKPLGPWTLHDQVGRYPNGSSVSKAQQNFVISVPGSDGKILYLWTGDRWQSAPDGLKDHDFQSWLPLEFETDESSRGGGPDRIRQMEWQDSFYVDVA
jgi:hypothetical protein